MGAEMTDFHAAMAAASVWALWEREGRHNFPVEPAHIWRWQTMAPLLDAAVEQTTMANAERRVLVLHNPAFADTDREGATTNLTVNLQILMPGERARPHRHSMNALRFALEGDGAVTIVEGKPCPMLPGDLILTPGWTWHEHAHEGRTRSVWIDALDVPIHRYLDNAVFEPGPAHDVTTLPPDAAFAGSGFAPDAGVAATPYSPMFRYPWSTAVEVLAALPPAPDGARRLRYTNPVNGGAIMATIDCYLLGLAKGSDTQPYRTNSNAVCVVVEGEGVSTVGDDTVRWGQNDVFTLPHGHWISHRADSDGAKLFQITDREMLRRLDLLRDEMRS
jgi:gentisate 1,2-dioxygenase